MYPRAKVLGIVLRGHQILVEEFRGRHSLEEGIYYRPIGGSIEFGEKSADALVREYNEELNVDIVIQQYIGCLENIFTINKEVGHEIIQLYVVKFKDKAHYKIGTFIVTEGNKESFVKWIPFEAFMSNQKLLYPTGIIERLVEMKGDLDESAANE